MDRKIGAPDAPVPQELDGMHIGDINHHQTEPQKKSNAALLLGLGLAAAGLAAGPTIAGLLIPPVPIVQPVDNDTQNEYAFSVNIIPAEEH